MTNSLNNKINELYNKIDAQDSMINQLISEKRLLQQRIDKALHKLKSSVNHFKTQRENNAVTFTIKILGDKENE